MPPLPPVREILRQYEVSANKSLGQNFLCDQNITDKIARNAGKLEGRIVLEVGPGPGLLTRSLLQAGAKKVIALEKDTRFAKILSEYLVPVSQGRLEIINCDALKYTGYINFSDKTTVIANLPYNIATALLFKWLDNISHFRSMILMFQKEVADRIIATPNSKSYGRMAIKSQLLCEVSKVYDLKPDLFMPRPKVDSSVVKLVPRASPLVDVDIEKLDTLCRHIFAQRRKTLRSSLKKLLGNKHANLESHNADLSKRPEQLSIEQICELVSIVDIKS